LVVVNWLMIERGKGFFFEISHAPIKGKAGAVVYRLAGKSGHILGAFRATPMCHGLPAEALKKCQQVAFDREGRLLPELGLALKVKVKIWRSCTGSAASLRLPKSSHLTGDIHHLQCTRTPVCSPCHLLLVLKKVCPQFPYSPKHPRVRDIVFFLLFEPIDHQLLYTRS
jgi:hypothetical protein